MNQEWDGTAIARFVIRFSPYRILTQFSNLYRHACVQRIVGLVRNYVSCCWRLRRNPRDTIKQVTGFCGAQGPALPKMHQCTNEGVRLRFCGQLFQRHFGEDGKYHCSAISTTIKDEATDPAAEQVKILSKYRMTQALPRFLGSDAPSNALFSCLLLTHTKCLPGV